jgi:hypothetical protein
MKYENIWVRNFVLLSLMLGYAFIGADMILGAEPPLKEKFYYAGETTILYAVLFINNHIFVRLFC